MDFDITTYENLTRKDEFEVFADHGDWGSINRAVEDFVDKTPPMDEAEAFFNDLFEVVPVLESLTVKTLGTLANYSDYLASKNRPKPSFAEMIESIVGKPGEGGAPGNPIAALMQMVGGGVPHPEDPRDVDLAHCEEVCDEQKRDACGLYQEALKLLGASKSITVH